MVLLLTNFCLSTVRFGTILLLSVCCAKDVIGLSVGHLAASISMTIWRQKPLHLWNKFYQQFNRHPCDKRIITGHQAWEGLVKIVKNITSMFLSSLSVRGSMLNFESTICSGYISGVTSFPYPIILLVL